MVTECDCETFLTLANRAANYVAKIFNVSVVADKDDMRQAAALRMLETGIIEFAEARRGADAWLKAWRKRNADFLLSERDSEEKHEQRDADRALALLDMLTGIHLSPTEWSVLAACVAGHKSRAFAAIANMSERSVWTHRQRIRRKLQSRLTDGIST